MAKHVALTHRTQYRYSRLVGLGPHVVRLRPAPHCRTPILAYSLRITPKPHFVNWQQDPFGNFMARIVVPDETREFSATVDLVADMATINPFDFFVEDAAASWPFTYEPVLAGELKPYLEPLPGTPLLDDYVRKIAGQSSTINISSSSSIADSARTLPTRSAWSRACRRPRRRWRAPLARAVTAAGCWCRSCDAWASRRALCPDT